MLTTAGVAGLLAAACGSEGGDAEGASTNHQVTVFATSSLTEAFTEIGDAFMAARPEIDVIINFAASSTLVGQIIAGARADVFASADLASMAKLVDAEGVSDDPVVFARNRLEIVVGPGNPTGIDEVGDLADPDLIVVTCAVEAPCGAYAQQLFSNAGVAVTPKSFEENVKSVMSKVVLGEADAGVVYSTDVLAAGDDASGVAIPDDVNVIAEYPVVVTQEAPDPDAGRAFIEFVLSPAGREILDRYGFLSP